MDGKDEVKPLAEQIKDQILRENIRMDCCRASFITGTEIFARRNKNRYSEAITEFTGKLREKKKKAFFDSPRLSGYVKGEKDGVFFPVSSGMICENCLRHLLQGAFMVAGRANGKDGQYSVEIVMPNSLCAEIVSELLADIPVSAKHTCRRGEEILYFRKNDTVADLLILLGANEAFYGMQYGARMNGYKSLVIRQRNCDSKNISRAVEAAGRQIKAIRAIAENEGLDSLPKTLRETALLRLENPSETLDGLVLAAGGGLTKSGINHRLKRIVMIAENKGYTDKN